MEKLDGELEMEMHQELDKWLKKRMNFNRTIKGYGIVQADSARINIEIILNPLYK